MILFTALVISMWVLLPLTALPLASTAADPVPINCVVIGDYQTAIGSDPSSLKEQSLVSAVLQNLFNDPTIDFHASLNYFGPSSAPSGEDDVEFTTMLDLNGIQYPLAATRSSGNPFPSSLSDFIDWLNDLTTFPQENRCLLFLSAVTDVTGIQLTTTDIYDSLIAVGLNENTLFPFTPTYTPLSIPWDTSADYVQEIVDLVKLKFVAPPTTEPTVTTTPKPTTEITSSRPLTTTTSRPTPGTTASPGPGGELDVQCKCSTETVWNDVMFVIDRSSETGSDGLSEMYDTMLTVLAFFNVQAAGTKDLYHLRVGVVFYNSEAVLAAPLGSTEEVLYTLNTDKYYQKNDKGSDLEKGLRLAMEQFDPTNPNRRQSSRKVIVVMTTTYNAAGVDAPQTIAAQFRDDNGILITYDYVEEHGQPATSLSQIASPGYSMNSIDHGIEDLSAAQCSANCFCQTNAAPFTQDARKSPTAGCYKSVDTPANELLAERGCVNRQKGFLVEIETAQKNEFIGKLIKPAADSLIGLKWNSTLAEWRWLDGSGLSSYSNFEGSFTHKSGLDCVYMEKNTNLWKTVDCRQGFKYICEAKPCDSTNYCDVGEE